MGVKKMAKCKWCGRKFDGFFEVYCSKKCETEAKGKEGCFLTTACVSHVGYEDDCYQLTTLRAFRDGYVRNLPLGEHLIKEYYSKSPMIVANISELPNSSDIWDNIFIDINRAITAIEKNNKEQAFLIYSELFSRMKKNYL